MTEAAQPRHLREPCLAASPVALPERVTEECFSGSRSVGTPSELGILLQKLLISHAVFGYQYFTEYDLFLPKPTVISGSLQKADLSTYTVNPERFKARYLLPPSCFSEVNYEEK